MAASLINRLNKAKPSLRLLASLNTGPQIANSQLISPEIMILGNSKLDSSSSSSSSLCSQIVFPSFPFAYSPIARVSLPIGPNQSGEVDSESEETSTVWADSTKQKRKKKMNKHKFQKRRKLLRRKS